MTLKFDGWPWKTIGHLFYATPGFVHLFVAISEFKLGLQFGNVQFWIKLSNFLPGVTLKFDGWHWKTIGHVFYATSTFNCAAFHNHQWIQTGARVRKRPIRVKFGDIYIYIFFFFFVAHDLEIRQMTLKNNRAPLLWHIKFCTSFHRHIWIQTGIMVRKRLNWVLTSVTLTVYIYN